MIRKSEFRSARIGSCVDMKNMTERLEIRLSPKEQELIQRKMDALGIKNRSAYIRKMAIDGYAIQVDLSDVKEVICLLRINSNNLNQYARKANESGCVYEEDIRDLQEQQKELWKEMKNILKKLAALGAR